MTSERAWRTTLRLVDAEEALQSAVNYRRDRPLPAWIRDIAGGADGREGFKALKEAVVGMQKELEELRTQVGNAPAAPGEAAPLTGIPTPEDAYAEAAAAIQQRDDMMSTFTKMSDELRFEKEKRIAANNALRVLEEKLASGEAQENVKDMGERICKANNKADEERRGERQEEGAREGGQNSQEGFGERRDEAQEHPAVGCPKAGDKRCP